MKLKIKVKRLDKSLPLPAVIDKGEWVDLRVSIPNEERVIFNKGQSHKFNLGIAMELPKGFEAIIAPRSSIFSNYGLILTNSLGIIDNSYSSDKDEWKAIFIKGQSNTNYINHGDRLCQFRIQLSQKATFFQKLKWLFSSGIEIKEVESLNNKIERGGYGSTGTK